MRSTEQPWLRLLQDPPGSLIHAPSGTVGEHLELTSCQSTLTPHPSWYPSHGQLPCLSGIFPGLTIYTSHLESGSDTSSEAASQTSTPWLPLLQDGNCPLEMSVRCKCSSNMDEIPLSTWNSVNALDCLDGAACGSVSHNTTHLSNRLESSSSQLKASFCFGLMPPFALLWSQFALVSQACDNRDYMFIHLRISSTQKATPGEKMTLTHLDIINTTIIAEHTELF